MPTQTEPLDGEQVPDNSERFTRTETESVELDYAGGNLSRIEVLVTWERGTRPTDSALSGGHVDTHTRAHVEYKLSNGVATLSGFYPDTQRTGNGRYRATLRSLRAMAHAYKEVQDRVDDDV